ncbi:hypothetical protein [Leifsonia sp. RAF41]|uniref:hypothetical protein n=1 Tax=Leifsonia sp. RAF41 TaxID=3233056 RepID=UPI003F9645D6
MTALNPRTIVGARSVAVERTPQRLDPLGAQSAWLLVPLLGAVAVAYAVFSTVRHSGQFRDLTPALVGILVLALAVVVAAIRTHPAFAPFGRWSHFGVIAGALTAACLFSASVWGRNDRIQDDWGQIAVALMIVAMPLYRPIGEVAGSAVVSAVVLGGLAAAQHSIVISNAPLVYATVAATPILALAAGGAGYAWTLTGETLRWREVAREGQIRLEGELRQAAQRMISQERMTALNAEAVPFLTGVAGRDAITAEDRDTARAIAERLRDLSVRAVERTWLEDTLQLALGQRLAQSIPAEGEPRDRVDDPDRLERVLTTDQRAIVGALIASIAGRPGLDPSSVRIAASDPDQPSFTLRARVDEPWNELRRELLPFVSSLNAATMRATMTVDGGELTVRFTYPERSFPYPEGRRQ